MFSAWALFLREPRAKKNYKIAWDDFRVAAVLMASYKDCGKAGCQCCNMVMQLLSNEAVQDYVAGTTFCEGKLPVETAM